MPLAPRAQINQAQRLLSQLQERISGEEASSALNWFRVDMILDSSTLTANTKFYALQILESAIKYRWKTLPSEQVTTSTPAPSHPHTRRAMAHHFFSRPLTPHLSPLPTIRVSTDGSISRV